MLSLVLVGQRPVVGDGAYVSLGAGARVVGGSYAADSARESLRDGFAGLGIVLDVAVGRAIVPGTALALVVSGDFAVLLDDVSGRNGSVSWLTGATGGLMVHHDLGGTYLTLELGGAVTQPLGGHDDVPDNAVRQAALFGPRAAVGFGWRWTRSGLALGLRLDGAVFDDGFTTMVPIGIAAQMRWLAF